MDGIQSMLSANTGFGRVSIGQNPIREIRQLSDLRELTCPLCGEAVVLKAGRLISPHFAHLPGSQCAHPESEPETPEHQAGKALLARWLGECLPGARVTVEALVPDTGQRADILVEIDCRRVALEYQCASLPPREWLRRHRQYRISGIDDLWLLGASRLNKVPGGLRWSELESAQLRYGAPLIFLDVTTESVIRFRKAGRRWGSAIPGRLSSHSLCGLPFPWNLLSWPGKAGSIRRIHPVRLRSPIDSAGDVRIARWLEVQFCVAPESMPPFFGIPIPGAEVFACSARMWQAALYYRFIHSRVGMAWQIDEVETWTRRYLPIAIENRRLLLRALYAFQNILAAAELLTEGKAAVLVKADFSSLGRIPDPVKVQQQAAYRQSLLWGQK